MRINGVPLFWSRKVSIRFFHHPKAGKYVQSDQQKCQVFCFFVRGIPGKQILNKQDKIGISWIWPPPYPKNVMSSRWSLESREGAIPKVY